MEQGKMEQEMNTVDVILHTTFLREDVLVECLDSLEQHKNVETVLLADTRPLEYNADSIVDGIDWSKYNKVKRFIFPHDMSPAMTRNYLYHKAKGNFIMKVDDDFVVSEKTKINDIIKFLRNNEKVGLVGMRVDNYDGSVSPFIYNFVFENGNLKLAKPKQEFEDVDGMKYLRCHVTPDMWIAKRQMFPECLWDERYHVGEGLHPDFFLNIHKNTNWQVRYTPDSAIDHLRHKIKMPVYYRKKRMRNYPDNSKLLDKWNIHEINIW